MPIQLGLLRRCFTPNLQGNHPATLHVEADQIAIKKRDQIILKVTAAMARLAVA